MKDSPLGGWALIALVGTVLLAVSVSSQSRQRVQSTQLAVKQPVAENPLSEWEAAYSEALKVATELAESGSISEARRLADDLQDVDRALRDYVRASERLRHKKRALFDTMEFLAIQNSIQSQSQQFQTLANALKAAHDAENSSIENMKQ